MTSVASMKFSPTHVVSPEDSGRIAERFVQARLRGASILEYPGIVPPTLEAAYAVQNAAIQLWPDQIAGWKVARVPPASRAAYNEERLVGPAFTRNLHRFSGDELSVPIIQGGFAAVEAEIVIVVGADAPSDKITWTAEEAATYVDSMHVGVEVASSPLATLNDLGAGSIISDFGNNWGVVVGPEIRDWRTRTGDLQCATYIDDALVGQAPRAVPQEPLAAFAFALSKCAQHQRPLSRGQAIATGMITGVHDIRIGQRARLTFEGYGEVLCRAVRQGDYRT